MAISINLLYSSPGPALILNKNIIPLLAKPPVNNGALDIIASISGASIFGGSTSVQP